MSLTPKANRIRVSVVKKPLSRSDGEKLEHVIVILPHRIKQDTLKSFPYASVVDALRKRTADPRAILQGMLPGPGQTGLTVGTVSKNASTFARLGLGRELIAAAAMHNPSSVGVALLETEADARDESASALAAAALAAGVEMPSFKSKPGKPARLRSVRLFGKPDINLRRIRVEADANNLARWLSALPPNKLDAQALIGVASQLAVTEGWHCEVYDEIRLAELGAEAFLCVGRGNEHSHAGIVHLHRPGAAKARHVALVGKGVCFDTGGINVKPANYMNGMHEDMEGSAVALASFRALCLLAPQLKLDCWLAVTENRINGNAYTPNEIVSAINGKTIEVIHSDAEGRMALADTLVLASRRKPDLLLDYATLTGSCVSALTTRYSGVFCNRPKMNAALIETGETSGERVWPFPLDADYDQDIESKQADVKQCAISGVGDHILAARFLSLFVDQDIPWVHMDLSAGNHKGGLAHIATDVTGFGVRFTTSLVLDKFAQDTL